MTKESLLDAVPIAENRSSPHQGRIAARRSRPPLCRRYPPELQAGRGRTAGIRRDPAGDGTGCAYGQPVSGRASDRRSNGHCGRGRWVEKISKQHRVTLLPGVLERARHTLCLATGPDKAEALKKVLRGTFRSVAVPSQIASPDTAWYIDKAAAAQLKRVYSIRRVRTAVPELSPCWLPSSVAVQSISHGILGQSASVSGRLWPRPRPSTGKLHWVPVRSSGEGEVDIGRNGPVNNHEAGTVAAMNHAIFLRDGGFDIFGRIEGLVLVRLPRAGLA